MPINLKIVMPVIAVLISNLNYAQLSAKTNVA